MSVLEIKNLTEKFGNNIHYYKNSSNAYNEHSCRVEYIDPLLKILGWDVANEKGLPPQYREVIAENYSNETDRPDYSLTLKGVTKLFVEAKKPAVDISTAAEPAFQTRKYGWNAKHKIAVLTNFEYLVIYDTTYIPKTTDGPDVARYRKYHYTEYGEKINEILELLSRDSVYTGIFDKFMEVRFPTSERQAEQIDVHFLKQINKWRVELSKYLYKSSGKYYDTIYERPLKDKQYPRVAETSNQFDKTTPLKYNSIEVLNDVVQQFINQIVFLRICEDRNLPLYNAPTCQDKISKNLS